MLAALPGDYGKPRPAVVIQSDLVAGTDSVLLCPLTTTLRQPSVLFRLDVDPVPETGLRARSQVMVDKISALRRDKCGAPVGRLDGGLLTQLDERLALIIGLADHPP